MNGGQNKIGKIVVDTNIIFMAWYSPFGKCAELLRKAREEKIKLFSPNSIKEGIINLPIVWVSREIYESILDKTKVKHKADKPTRALALVLNCGILNVDKHFKSRVDVNKLLSELEKNDA